MQIEPGVYPHRVLSTRLRRAELNRAVRAGTAVRLRSGWYAVGAAHPDEVSAVRAGGVLSCVSALRRHGVWVPDDPHLHVRGNVSAVRRHPERYCRRYGRPEPESGAVDDLPTALQYAARCLDAEGLVVVADSMLNQGLLSREEIEHTLRDTPATVQQALDRCDGRAAYGLETMVRLRLQSQNIRTRLQVPIDGVGRVDLLVVRWLIIETDGWEYHGDRTAFENDRRRDQAALALGYLTLHLTSRQITDYWERCNGVILDLVRRRAHLRRH
ncbi:endonuclease domain-containing protein [Gordonia sp. VNK21]|uniref:endonuclease domain-containing protein n=1 Tax=Gordonia sp. VNK21 TaxID=3382483 RepID=UPI0038D4E555